MKRPSLPLVSLLEIVIHSVGFLFIIRQTDAFIVVPPKNLVADANKINASRTRLYADWKDESQNSVSWRSIDDEKAQNEPELMDWQEILQQKKDGSFWSTFDSSIPDDPSFNGGNNGASATPQLDEDQEADAWLDTLALLSAEEVEFNLKEADRADKARQMEEWGFDRVTISNTLDLAIQELNEEEPVGMQTYREQSFLEDVDLETVESHKMVERYEDSGEPVRSQMVYVDEHTCIGCTNCAMIAQSTFFMHSEYGRARVFNQWGDDDETIQVAIETCPVDCIHYVPYEELVALEKDRRNQRINFKARLVSQSNDGNSRSHLTGGAFGFTAPQKISGNMKSRCSNCPSRGCADCPMYGVGKNPDFLKKEAARKERMAKAKLQQEREANKKSLEL